MSKRKGSSPRSVDHKAEVGKHDAVRKEVAVIDYSDYGVDVEISDDLGIVHRTGQEGTIGTRGNFRNPYKNAPDPKYKKGSLEKKIARSVEHKHAMTDEARQFKYTGSKGVKPDVMPDVEPDNIGMVPIEVVRVSIGVGGSLNIGFKTEEEALKYANTIELDKRFMGCNFSVYQMEMFIEGEAVLIEPAKKRGLLKKKAPVQEKYRSAESVERAGDRWCVQIPRSLTEVYLSDYLDFNEKDSKDDRLKKFSNTVRDCGNLMRRKKLQEMNQGTPFSDTQAKRGVIGIPYKKSFRVDQMLLGKAHTIGEIFTLLESNAQALGIMEYDSKQAEEELREVLTQATGIDVTRKTAALGTAVSEKRTQGKQVVDPMQDIYSSHQANEIFKQTALRLKLLHEIVRVNAKKEEYVLANEADQLKLEEHLPLFDGKVENAVAFYQKHKDTSQKTGDKDILKKLQRAKDVIKNSMSIEVRNRSLELFDLMIDTKQTTYDAMSLPYGKKRAAAIEAANTKELACADAIRQRAEEYSRVISTMPAKEQLKNEMAFVLDVGFSLPSQYSYLEGSKYWQDNKYPFNPDCLSESVFGDMSLNALLDFTAKFRGDEAQYRCIFDRSYDQPDHMFNISSIGVLYGPGDSRKKESKKAMKKIIGQDLVNSEEIVDSMSENYPLVEQMMINPNDKLIKKAFAHAAELGGTMPEDQLAAWQDMLIFACCLKADFDRALAEKNLADNKGISKEDFFASPMSDFLAKAECTLLNLLEITASHTPEDHQSFRFKVDKAGFMAKVQERKGMLPPEVQPFNHAEIRAMLPEQQAVVVEPRRRSTRTITGGPSPFSHTRKGAPAFASPGADGRPKPPPGHMPGEARDERFAAKAVEGGRGRSARKAPPPLPPKKGRPDITRKTVPPKPPSHAAAARESKQGRGRGGDPKGGS